MKKITKIIALALVIGAGTFSMGKAQETLPLDENKGVRFGFGISGGIGEKDSPFKNSYGADARFQFDLSNYVSITATGGYTKLVADDGFTDYDFIPVKGGVKVFPLTVKGFYGAGEAGAGIATKKDSKTAFVWSTGVGYEWKNGFDLSARYEAYSQDSASNTYVPYNGQFALRLAYGFKL